MSNTTKLPPKTAQNVLVKTMISMIIKNDFETRNAEGNQVFLMESLLSNPVDIKRKVTSGRRKDFPRNANYAYNSLGYTECILPVDLIVSYVMKSVFDEFYKMYRKGGDFYNLKPESKENVFFKFLELSGLTEKEVGKNPVSRQTLEANVNKAYRQMMTSENMGPFYAIDFTYFLVSDEYHFLDKYIKKFDGGVFGPSKKDINCQNAYKMLKRYLLELNNKTFGIYTTVIEEISSIINEDANILTAPEIFKSQFSTTFSWTPIAFDGDSKGHNALEQFVGKRYIARAHEFARELSADLWDRRDEWTDIENISSRKEMNSGAAKAIREFVSAKVGDKVNKDKELLLTIAYSGNPDAELDDPQGNPTQDVKTAAAQIYADIKQNALPLANYVNNMYTSIAPLKYIAIPSDWTRISRELKDLAGKDSMEKFNVYHTNVDDKISAFAVNHGLAPFMLVSVANHMEQAYEVNATEVGLHLVQGENENWADLQNLNVMDRWNLKLEDDGWKENDGEDANFDRHPEASKREAEAIYSTFKKADYLMEKGLIKYQPSGEQEYPYVLVTATGKSNVDSIVSSLGINDDANAMTEFDINALFDGESYAKLKNSKLFREEKITYYNMVTTDPNVALESDEDKKAKWYYSKQILYRNFRLRKLLEKTYDIVKELTDVITSHNDEVEHGIRSRGRIGSFIKLLGRGNIVFDEDFMSWMTHVPGRKDEYIIDMSSDSNIKLEHKLYAVYKWFVSQSADYYDEIIQDCIPKMTELSDEEMAEEKNVIQKEKQYKADLKELLKPMMENKKSDKWNFSINSASFTTKASQAGLDPVDVEKFYHDLYENQL